MGYYMAGFEVIGVDIKPQPHYPFEFHQADALQYALEGFDVIHASPPCQAYSKSTKKIYRGNHKRMISAIRNRLIQARVPFVIENVEGARHRLIQPVMLCGSMFNLNIQRHRYFEINPLIAVLLPCCDHKPNPVYITGTRRLKGKPRQEDPAAVKRQALETPWMTVANMDEAIPPAYTHYIGVQLKKYLDKH